MRLKNLKLSGFKSFVDQSTLNFKDKLVGVVGPNGCGKSNVIDAVRWVMGESSAKNLRGDSMASVIFNGSSQRKPASKASVELVFDNSTGKIGGEYANYDEISVRRELTSDAQSTYFLNGTKCRRRDVSDIFLGTGLGPRSYSIIEQGMISSIVEAKDLRSFVEEAAGISVYKKRRHDTELRITHTQENLSRIDDLISEQERLLERLKRQSRAALKYNKYKEDYDLLDLQLAGIRWKNFDENFKLQEEKIREKSIELEEKLSNKTKIDKDLSKVRVEYGEKTDITNEIQANFYEISSEITKIEQTISHQKERKQQLEEDLENVKRTEIELTKQIKEDKLKLDELLNQQNLLTPDYEKEKDLFEKSKKCLFDAREELASLNDKWEKLQKDSQEPQKNSEIEKAKIDHLEKQSREIQINIDRLEQEQTSLKTVDIEDLINSLKEEITIKEMAENETKEKLDNLNNEINLVKQKISEFEEKIDIVKVEIQKLKGKRASLEALQERALGKDEKNLNLWLQENNLDSLPRLAELLEVEFGFEKAFETVLGDYLEAICVKDLTAAAITKDLNLDYLKDIDNNLLFISDVRKIISDFALENNVGNTLENAVDDTLENNVDKNIDQNLFEQDGSNISNDFEKIKLLDKVKTDIDLEFLMSGIYIADDLANALLGINYLSDQESIVTKDGIWLSKNWIRLYADKKENKQGVLLREKELNEINELLSNKEKDLAELKIKKEKIANDLSGFEKEKNELQKNLQLINKDLRILSSEFSSQNAKFENVLQRNKNIIVEKKENSEKLEKISNDINLARIELEKEIEQMSLFSEKLTNLQLEKDKIIAFLAEAEDKFKLSQENLHKIEIDRQTIITKIDAIKEGLRRLQSNLSSLDERKKNIDLMLEDVLPQDNLKNELNTLLNRKVDVEHQLSDAKNVLEDIEEKINNYEDERLDLEKIIQEIRNALDSLKMEKQSLSVRRDTICEKFEKEGKTTEEILNLLEDDADEIQIEENLNDLSKKMERLGPINLAAVEEYKAESERAQYLQSQHEDLTEALLTLNNAIKKIDKETRAKFKGTFDKIDENFRNLFPKLFGGGEAYLELTGVDLLDSGVAVMARPPGKRNTTIQLLSGGEKALTAVALVFAIFKLNPSPFCMLDEVDAPLDDSNVDRFCNLIKEMSEKVQFILITHNKITMEIVSQLVGVTMKEPGVSRLVFVDVDEAVEFVES